MVKNDKRSKTNKIRKIFKIIGLSISSLIVLIAIIVVLFLTLSPQFGKSPTKKQIKDYEKTGHYQDGKFINISPTPLDAGYWKITREFLKENPNRVPSSEIEVDKIDSLAIANHKAGITQLIWFGHSAFLLLIDGKKILIDPMFGSSPSPIEFLGPKRFSKELPIEIERLPFIDAVIISHDHYDHLDYNSIKKLNGKVGQFFTPLGVGNHLLRWGVAEDKIHELDWWESIRFKGIDVVSCPARHFSGRGIFDKSSTLWCSWVISGSKDNIYFSGDSGYDTHFKKIGEKYGPFDISLIECGQYNENWKLIHMFPEESVQAAIDLKSKLVMPIHWGAFSLAIHDWSDSVERIVKKADELHMPVATPGIGQPLIINNGEIKIQYENWWENFMP